MERIVDFGKVEKIETMKPDSKLLELTEKIIDQNNLILEMNKILIRSLAYLPIIVSNEEQI